MAIETTDVTLEILRRMQVDQAEHRRETRAIQQSFVELARLVQRLDTRLSDIKADLETMFKMEIIGQFAHFETRFETRLDETLDRKLAPILEKLEQLAAK